MGSLTEELFNAGVITEEEKKRTLTKDTQQMETRVGQQLSGLLTKSNRPDNFDRLESCGSVGEFKNIAKKILTEQPDRINEIIGLAQRFKDSDGGKKLIWLLHQIKDSLLKVRDKEKFLKRALRRSGGTIELSH